MIFCTMRYMKNKRMLKRYLIFSVLFYSAVSDYTMGASFYVRFKIIY